MSADPWREEFERIPDADGQLELYFADPLLDTRITLEEVERQAAANADRVERELGDAPATRGGVPAGRS